MSARLILFIALATSYLVVPQPCRAETKVTLSWSVTFTFGNTETTPVVPLVESGVAKPEAPAVSSGLKVLMVYETADVPRLPRGQQHALFGERVSRYLETKCALGPDGRTREYRVFDKDADVTGEGKFWKDSMRRPRKSVPWVIISGRSGSYEGPLPTTVEGTLSLLKEYGEKN